VVNIKNIVTGTILIIAGIVIFFFVFESQETRIKKQFKFIAEKMEKSPGESPILSGAKVKSLKKVFVSPCFINIPAYSYSKETDSDSLSRYVFTMRSRYSGISMKFHDYLFDYLDETSARVTITAGMRGVLSTGEIVEDIHEVACSLTKTDDTWKFVAIEVVQVLEK
jgi:hypothetical protein